MKSKETLIDSKQRRRILLLITTLNLILSVMIQAQETGQVSFNGISFDIPQNWKGVSQNNLYLLASDTEAGIIIIIPGSFNDVAGLQNELNKQQTDGTSIWLNRVNEIEKIGKHALGAKFVGTFNYEKAAMYVSGKVTGNNRGIMVYAGTTTEMYSDRYKQLSMQILNSIRTTQSSASASASKSNAGGKSNEWVQFYANTRLTYMNSYYSSSYGEGSISGGYSNKIIIDLCSQGYFTYRNDFEMSGGGDFSSFGSSDGKQGSGTWTIIPVSKTEATLVLTFYNGQITKYTMTYNYEKGSTHLNGDRFYRTTMKDSPEFQPRCY